jgi:uncharacterized protein (DUF486 family)
MSPLQIFALTATMLAASNLFMTFAGYGHLKPFPASPWWIAPFTMLYVGEGLEWNHLWAGLCLVGAVCFIFRG